MTVAEIPIGITTSADEGVHAFLADLFSLAGRTAVVVGGGGVLAGEMASGLAEAGANVVIADLNESNAQRQAEAIRERGRKALPCAADVTRKTDIQHVLETTLAHFGSVDVVVNAAGVNSGTPFFEIEEREWEHILDVDLRSVFLSCQVFGKSMAEAGKGGSIINISSASSDPPLSRVFTYCVAKGGVNQITKYLAKEFAPYGVRVNAIQPGFFPAEQNRKLLTEERVASIMSHTPMRRFGRPSELVGVTLYLASEQASSFVTGSIMRVDGGFGAMTI
ncbi:MAG TPA: SDR family oxidoreductase [Bryobacteraceae bacterium]|nr:SDR family oxidoreductase [Bryobacteraceae bacterium]